MSKIHYWLHEVFGGVAAYRYIVERFVDVPCRVDGLVPV